MGFVPPNGYITYSGKLTKHNMDNLKRQWARRHTGTTCSHRIPILEEGFIYHPDTIEHIVTPKLTLWENYWLTISGLTLLIYLIYLGVQYL